VICKVGQRASGGCQRLGNKVAADVQATRNLSLADSGLVPTADALLAAFGEPKHNGDKQEQGEKDESDEGCHWGWLRG